ncbi:MAG: response regulator, partial [Bryobacteraceae bacterium]
PADLRGRPVLVVDDNATNRRILDAMLTNWGMRPTLVDCGTAALRAMERARDDDRPFAIVLLDYQMPDMDGFEATRRIRASAGGSHAYIIAMTANAMTGDRERCLEAGMDDYLAKPVSIAGLEQAIARYLARPVEAMARE